MSCLYDLLPECLFCEPNANIGSPDPESQLASFLSSISIGGGTPECLKKGESELRQGLGFTGIGMSDVRLRVRGVGRRV